MNKYQLDEIVSAAKKAKMDEVYGVFRLLPTFSDAKRSISGVVLIIGKSNFKRYYTAIHAKLLRNPWQLNDGSLQYVISNIDQLKGITSEHKLKELIDDRYEEPSDPVLTLAINQALNN